MNVSVCMYVCVSMYMCIYVCVYVCMYLCMYACMYTHTPTHVCVCLIDLRYFMNGDLGVKPWLRENAGSSQS